MGVLRPCRDKYSLYTDYRVWCNRDESELISYVTVITCNYPGGTKALDYLLMMTTNTLPSTGLCSLLSLLSLLRYSTYALTNLIQSCYSVLFGTSLIEILVSTITLVTEGVLSLVHTVHYRTVIDL